ncbi:hypothetical protein A0130_07895 [Leifsonia xyli]|nr:hypothetical protein A0130_07895 [Leifsonia xyli]
MLAIAMIVVVAVPVLSFCAVAGYTVVVIVGALHPFATNEAEKKIKPFEVALEKEGGTRLCGNGDAGYGPDNLTPWSMAYYVVPHAGRISETLKQTASAQGYDLSPAGHEDDGSPVPDEALRSGDSLRISIYRSADVPLYCEDVERYGEARRVDGDDAIVEVGVQLPAHTERVGPATARIVLGRGLAHEPEPASGDGSAGVGTMMRPSSAPPTCIRPSVPIATWRLH